MIEGGAGASMGAESSSEIGSVSPARATAAAWPTRA